MKKIIFALSLLLLCSCSYLDVVPEGKATEEDIWKTEEQAENYRYYMQTYMPNLIGYDWSPDQFAGDDFISVENLAHGNRLNNAELLDGRGELLKRNRIEVLARLVRVWVYFIHRKAQHAHTVLRPPLKHLQRFPAPFLGKVEGVRRWWRWG